MNYYIAIALLLFLTLSPITKAQSFGKHRTTITQRKSSSIPRKSSSIPRAKPSPSSYSAPKSQPAKKGMISKMKDAAVRGYGWQLGKEAARETIKGVKEAAHSETATNMKNKIIEKAKKVTGKE